MPTFNYKVRDKKGNLGSGTIDATSEGNAAEILMNKDLYIVSLVPKDREFNVENILSKYIIVSLKHLMVFTKQFSVMINAGLPIVESLKTLAEEESNIKFAEIIADVAKRIEGGESLSESLSNYPDVFSPIYVNMVKVGEASGKLDTVLLKIADQLEKDHDIGTKVKGAMIYPSFIMMTLIAVSLLMVTFVIPRLRPILEGAGVELPFLTKGLILLSEAFMGWWWLIIPGIFLGFYLLRLYSKTAKGGDYWDYIKIKLPVAGPIVKKIYLARLTRTFSTLISGGINVIGALEITSEAIGNVHYKRELIDISKKVKNGVSLTEAFKKSEIFPRILKQMMHVGENTGTLDTTIGKLADFFEGEVENVVNNLSKILEPLLIIIMGIGVALAVSSVIMPLYDITKAVK